MCKPFSLKCVPSVEALPSYVCLNYVEGADSSSRTGKHFSDFHCLEEELHWTKLLSASSAFFTVLFSMSTESLSHEACSTCVSICLSAAPKMLWHDTWKTEWLSQSRCSLLGNNSVNRFPRQRIHKQQFKCCWTVVMETVFSVGAALSLYNEDLRLSWEIGIIRIYHLL
jgi:hypothetical protein